MHFVLNRFLTFFMFNVDYCNIYFTPPDLHQVYYPWCSLDLKILKECGLKNTSFVKIILKKSINNNKPFKSLNIYIYIYINHFR